MNYYLLTSELYALAIAGCIGTVVFCLIYLFQLISYAAGIRVGFIRRNAQYDLKEIDDYYLSLVDVSDSDA